MPTEVRVPLSCPHCQYPSPWSASFCPRCGESLQELEAPPLQVRRPELCWSSAGDYSGPIASGHRLLAVARSGGGCDIFHPEQAVPWVRLEGDEPLLALQLTQHLLLSWSQHQLQIFPLLPRLYGRSGRIDRSCSWPLVAAPACPPTHHRQQLLWASPTQLECLQLTARGLVRAWQRPQRDVLGLLAWGEDWISLGVNSLQLWSGQSGEPLQRWSFPGPLRDWWMQDQQLLLLSQSGEVLRLVGRQLHSLWHGGDAGFALAAHRRHAVVVRGSQALVLTLDSGQSQALELLHPCVLRPLVQEHWALLPSYDGMLYQLSLGARPGVVAAYTLSSSYEPSTRPPLLWGQRLFEIGPEGELRCWLLA